MTYFFIRIGYDGHRTNGKEMKQTENAYQEKFTGRCMRYCAAGL